MGELWSDVGIAFGQNKFCEFNFPSRIAPVFRCGQHRGERAKDIRHSLSRYTLKVVDEELLILGPDLVQTEFPEMRNDV